MLNILSTTEKKKVRTEYWLRLAIVAIFAIGTLAAVSLVLMAPSYLLAETKFSEAERSLSALQKKYGDNTQEKDLGVQIRDINNKILLLTNTTTGTGLLPSQTILSILAIKNSAIKLIGISYQSTSVSDRIVLTGTAATRDTLSQFAEDLKKEPTFTNVTLPISSYVKSTNIDFSIVIDRRANSARKK